MKIRIVGAGIASGHTIQVMTQEPHGILEPKQVTVTGVNGIPDANGSHTATPNSPTKLILDGSTFSGSYVNGGVVEFV